MPENMNLKLLPELLKALKPDLEVVCDDRQTVWTHKILVGTSSQFWGEMFLAPEFLQEPVTTVVVPASSEEVTDALAAMALGDMDYGALLWNNLFGTISKKDVGQSFGPEHFEADINNDIEQDKKESKIKESVLNREEVDIKKVAKTFHFPNWDNTSMKMEVKLVSLKESLESEKLIDPASMIMRKPNHQKSGSSQCYKCGKILCNKQYLINHLDICGKTKAHGTGLGTKKEGYSNNRVYKCKQCDFTGISATLKTHSEVHNGVLLKTCEICGFTGKRMKRHIQRNHNVKSQVRVKCDECGKQIKKNGMEKHKLIVHTTQRKHPCNDCEYKAGSKYNLKLHVNKMHLGNNTLPKEECAYCDFQTTNMLHHMKVYHPDKI